MSTAALGDSNLQKVSIRRPNASYGLDAPYLLLIPAALILWNLVNALLRRTAWSLLGAAAIAACTGLGVYASRRGKFVVWEKLLDDLHFRGDEHVLDLGCGRGAVLLLAARRLTTGRAVGVDLWRRADQSGNSIDATRRNAQAEGVADRVDLHTADMTNLPFADETFDLVLSSIAIHNVKTRAGRRNAIEEAVRVLRPGGRLLIADLWGTRQYAKQMMQLGMINITRRGLGWRMWWTGPWVATRLVSATMPVSDKPSPSGGAIAWVTVARLANTAQWHQARAALAASQIVSLMGEGEDVGEAADACAPEGIALQVPKSDAPRAHIILQHCLSGRRWCPRCGSADLRNLPLPWYWIVWSVLFLGIAPFVPPRWQCRNCNKRIY